MARSFTRSRVWSFVPPVVVYRVRFPAAHSRNSCEYKNKKGLVMSDQELMRDGERWQAFAGLPGYIMMMGGFTPCASCESAGLPVNLVNVFTAAVVPWDVLGESRAFAFVCRECSGAGDEYDARDYVETKRYCDECNYELDDAYKDSETLCGACVNVAESVARDYVDGHGFTLEGSTWFHCAEPVRGSVTGDSFAECRECDAVIEWSELTGVES